MFFNLPLYRSPDDDPAPAESTPDAAPSGGKGSDSDEYPLREPNREGVRGYDDGEPSGRPRSVGDLPPGKKAEAEKEEAKPGEKAPGKEPETKTPADEATHQVQHELDEKTTTLNQVNEYLEDLVKKGVIKADGSIPSKGAVDAAEKEAAKPGSPAPEVTAEDILEAAPGMERSAAEALAKVSGLILKKHAKEVSANVDSQIRAGVQHIDHQKTIGDAQKKANTVWREWMADPEIVEALGSDAQKIFAKAESHAKDDALWGKNPAKITENAINYVYRHYGTKINAETEVQSRRKAEEQADKKLERMMIPSSGGKGPAEEKGSPIAKRIDQIASRSSGRASELSNFIKRASERSMLG